jgi:hypothetical protein
MAGSVEESIYPRHHIALDPTLRNARYANHARRRSEAHHSDTNSGSCVREIAPRVGVGQNISLG